MEKSRECFSLRNTHRTLASGAPDAGVERPVQSLPGPARVRHRTIGTGRWSVRPVVRVRCEVRFVDLSGCESGVHRTRPVLTCSASGALEVTVRLWHEKFKRRHVADVGAPDARAERPVPL